MEELGPYELIGSKEMLDLEYDMRENFDLATRRFSDGSEYESDDTTIASWSHCDSISVNTDINECFNVYSTVFNPNDICLMTTYKDRKFHINKMFETLNQHIKIMWKYLLYDTTKHL